MFWAGHLWAQQMSAQPEAEQAKIDYLIACVENLSDAKFIRNGLSYDAKTAAAHLRMKRKKAGNYVKTTNDFIEKLASKSSVTGNLYKIIYNDGKVIEACEFYMKCIDALNQL
jgi:hypothetical protein